MNKPDFLQDEWTHILNMLPLGFENGAYDKLAMRRRRSIQTPGDLLRLCLAYGVCDLSLRQTAAWAAVVGLGEMSDVAVLKRLRNSADWLGTILAHWLRERGLTGVQSDRRIRLIDASVVRSPGAKAPDYRLHLGLQLEPLQIRTAEVTELAEGEHFRRHSLEPDEIAIADRGYATQAGVAWVLEHKAHVIVRVHWRNLPLYGIRGGRLNVLDLLTTVQDHEIGDWPVKLHYGYKQYDLRLIATKKTAQAAREEQKKLRRNAQKHGIRVDKRSLLAARYTYVVTDLPREQFSASDILELYRMRWQIELVFKRMKSLLNLANLRAKEPQLARAYLFSKLLGALIVEELSGSAVAFFPWGYPQRRPTAQYLASARPTEPAFVQRDQGDDNNPED